MKAIQTKYYGPTNSRGARIIATAEGGPKPHKVTIPYPHELSGMDCHAEAALTLCRKMGWPGVLIGGGLTYSYVFVFAPSDYKIGKKPEYSTYQI